MGFSLSHNNELNSVVRGTSAADTPMSNQDFDVLISIQDFDVSTSRSIQDNALPMFIRDDESPSVIKKIKWCYSTFGNPLTRSTKISNHF